VYKIYPILNTSKKYKVIGIMSGTSIDGVDFSFLETNGTNYAKVISGTSYKYNIDYKLKIKKFINKLQKNLNTSLQKIDDIVSKKFLKMTKKFFKEFKINPNKIDYIGFSGQTVLHLPNKKISIQLGSGKFLAEKLKINIISNFRQNDIIKGGQGAPIASFYNQYLIKKINKNFAFVNIGGISNICYATKKNIIAFDLGPGNALIDDYALKKINKNYDNNGNISKKGNLNKKILDFFIKNSFFKKNYPKSLDRNHFNLFLKKVDKLSNEDAMHTLSMMTVYCIKFGIKLLKKNNIIIDGIVLTGGGRKNTFILNKLKEILNIKITNIDNLGLNGDLIEAESFGYIAIRSIKKLPLSLPTTTGVKKPTTGGTLNSIN